MSEAVCWNCNQMLRAGSPQCLWCGVAQRQAQPAHAVVSPFAQQAAPAVATVTPSAAHPVQAAPVIPQAARGIALGEAFHGVAASTGVQLLSFTIDVVAVAAASTLVWLLTASPIFATIAIFEFAVALWVLEARTGLTIGNALLRLRVSRDDSPYSPGVGRSFVRRFVTQLGFLAGGVGAWIVVASGAWNSRLKARGWADVAARTVMVSVPKRTRRPLTSELVELQTARQDSPGLQSYAEVETPIILAVPQVISTLVRPQEPGENSISQSYTGVPQGGFAATPLQAAPVSQQEPASNGAGLSVPETADGTILLVFDTGQREQFAAPVAVNLGRNPVHTEATDQLVIVQDHESTVSKTHLRVEHSRGRTWVTDYGSTNGTELLGDEGEVTTLEPGNRVLLDEGVRVRMGNRAFTISLLLGRDSS